MRLDLSVQFAPAYPRAVRLALLGLGQRPGFFTLKRILAGVELNPERRALQFEGFAEGALQIARITGRHIVQAAAMNHDQRRVAAALMGVAHFGGEAPPFGRLLLPECRYQDAGKLWC